MQELKNERVLFREIMYCVYFLPQLPDVTSQLQNIQNSVSNVSLNRLIEEGQQQFDNISQIITTTIDENLDG